MPDPSKPVPLEVEAVEAAERAFDSAPFGCPTCDRERLEEAIHVFLDAMGVTVEHDQQITVMKDSAGSPIAVGPPPSRYRLVSDWFPIKGPVDE